MSNTRNGMICNLYIIYLLFKLVMTSSSFNHLNLTYINGAKVIGSFASRLVPIVLQLPILDDSSLGHLQQVSSIRKANINSVGKPQTVELHSSASFLH